MSLVLANKGTDIFRFRSDFYKHYYFVGMLTDEKVVSNSRNDENNVER